MLHFLKTYNMFLTAWCVSYIICFPFSTVFTIYFQLFYSVLLGARGRTRTDTPLRVQDFESSASTIPPLGQSCCLFRVAYLTSLNFILPLFFTCFSMFFTTLFFLVPQAGLEPARPCDQRILSPVRLPFHHWGNSCCVTS